MSTTESPSTPTGWKAGAKALAQFQAQHHGVAKGGKVTGGPREGSKYATLSDILAVCSSGAQYGLSHSGEARLLGESLLVWREVLHHESGESIYTEHPIAIPTKGLPGQIQQDLGGGITYARKYCLQGLYGLYADDGLDPDSVSYGDAARPVASANGAADKLAKSMGNGTVVLPNDIALQQPERPADDPQRPLTEDEIQLCKEILKDPDRGADFKADFKKQFYASREGALRLSDIKTKEHLDFLTERKSALPF